MSSTSLAERIKSPRIPWTDEEMKIVLGYYYFIYVNNTRKQDYASFGDDLRKKTSNNRSNGSLGFRFSNFGEVDPLAKSGLNGGHQPCLYVWNECINPDRTPKESFIKLFMSFIEEYGNKKTHSSRKETVQ